MLYFFSYMLHECSTFYFHHCTIFCWLSTGSDIIAHHCTIFCWLSTGSDIIVPIYFLHIVFFSFNFRLLTDFVCLYTYEFLLSLCKIVRSSVILLLPLFLIGFIHIYLYLFPWFGPFNIPVKLITFVNSVKK